MFSGFPCSVELLRHEEDTLHQAAELLGVPVDDVLGGLERRMSELSDARKALTAAKRQAAIGRADEYAAAARDGIVVERVDDLDRDSLKDLAVAIRDRGVSGVALGAALESGGVALVAAVGNGSELHAGDWIADAAKLVGGGGRKAPDVSVAGGR